MFLRPQHFQQMERSVEMLVDARTGWSHSHAWGFSRLHIDQDALRIGRISLKSAEGILPDGTPFSIPEDYPAPAALEVGADVKDALVLLALPARRAGMAEFALSPGEGADATLMRYVGTDSQVMDAVEQMQEAAEMKLARLNLRLMLETQPREAFCAMGLARIVERRSTGQVALDESYIPPALQCRGIPRLHEFLKEASSLVRHRTEILAARLSQSAQKNIGEISDFLMLQVANRARPLLNHLAESERLHPETLYGELCQITGEFSTFSSAFKRCAKDYPPYRHEDLRGSFEPLMHDLRTLLTEVVNPNAVQLPLQERAKGLYTAQIPDAQLLHAAVFVLVANADMPSETLRRNLPLHVKIGPPEKIRDLVMSQLPGVSLVPLPMAPPRLPYYAGFTYFELDKRSELWKLLDVTRLLALHVAGDFPGLKLELWALRP
jgi:type VI secretion system protein ImpJ